MKINTKLNTLLVAALAASFFTSTVIADVKVRLRASNNFVVEDRSDGADNLKVDVGGGISIPRGGLAVTGGLTFDKVADSGGVVTASEAVTSSAVNTTTVDVDTAVLTGAAVLDIVDVAVTTATDSSGVYNKTSGVREANANWNTYTTGGAFTAFGGTTNRPDTFNGFEHVTVFRGWSNGVTQMAIDGDGSGFAVRRSNDNGSTWSDWNVFVPDSTGSN